MKIHDLKKRFGADRAGYLIFFIFLVFFLVRGACLLMTTDDVWWDTFDSLSEVMKGYNPNGRLFTNAITYYICNHYAARVIVYVVTMGAFILSIVRLLEFSFGKGKWTAVFFAGLVILLSPGFFTQHIYNWISGFTNYIISLIFILLYIRFCAPIFEKREIKPPKAAAVFWLIWGFLGAMCLENITLYNLVFGAFIIILSLVYLKKVSLSNIAFMIGTVFGSVLMFYNQRYSEIYSQGDAVGIRSYDLTLSDCMMKIYLYFTHSFLRPYFVLHIIIMLSVIVLYQKKCKHGGGKLKYAGVCISAIIFFTVYSFFTTISGELAVMSQAYRIRALEAALTALYIICLCYMICGLLSGGKRIRAIIYLLSPLVVTAPFIFVNPVTARCFFAGYVFWSLVAFTLAAELIRDGELSGQRIIKSSAALFSGAFLFTLAYIDVTNKYADTVRTRYIKQQLADDARYIEIIRLPYENSCFDPLDVLKGSELIYHKNGQDYPSPELYCMTNDIDLSLLDKEWTFIGMIDYNTSRDK